MRSLVIIFISMTSICCGPVTSNTKADPKEVYSKQELTGFSACIMEHSECNDINKYCVESPRHLGGTRQCMRQNQIGEFFECTSGELIILPDEPWRLDCL